MAVLRAPLAAALLVGCGGVPIRPDGSPGDEKCPPGAREAMEALHLRPGSSVEIDVDATQRRAGALIVYDGPIESVTWAQRAELPPGTLLQGRVWTGGPRVVIRYYSARLPDGRTLPFCALAVWENDAGLPKAPGRPGSAALARTFAWMVVTGQFR